MSTELMLNWCHFDGKKHILSSLKEEISQLFSKLSDSPTTKPNKRVRKTEIENSF